MAIGGDARNLTPGQSRKVLDVNMHGVVCGTLAAYPIMVKQGFGHVVSTSPGPAWCRRRSTLRTALPNTRP
jgi:NADP-dependent 3-hydroxy acid dehydrogenase YdfG